MALQGLAYPATIWTSHGNTLLKRVFFLGHPRKTQWGVETWENQQPNGGFSSRV
jgi:hypothetical protein